MKYLYVTFILLLCMMSLPVFVDAYSNWRFPVGTEPMLDEVGNLIEEETTSEISYIADERDNGPRLPRS